MLLNENTMPTTTDDQEISPTSNAKSLNYVIIYDLKEKKVGGYQQACTTTEEVKDLKISEMGPEVRNGWVKFANNKYGKNLNNIEEAKWVLKFPKGNPDIDTAWAKLTDLVIENKIWDIKATSKSERDTQVIGVYCVYSSDSENPHFKNNHEQMLKVYDVLEKNGLIALHMQHECNQGVINFSTDRTVRMTQKDEQVIPTYTNNDIEGLHTLYQQKEKMDQLTFPRKWQAQIQDLEIKAALNIPLKHATTYFSETESLARRALLERLEAFQTKNNIQADSPFYCHFKALRTTLTGIYRFPTPVLIENALNLLNANPPKSTWLLEQIPLNRKCSTTRDFFKQLIKEENVRLDLQQEKGLENK